MNLLRESNGIKLYNDQPFTGKGLVYKEKTKLKPTKKKLEKDTVRWIEVENDYVNGLIQKQTTFYSADEKQLEIDNIKGEYHEWYDGAFKSKQKPKVEGQLKNKLKHGKWIFYYKSGQISAEGNYIEDQKNGKWTHYHSNGKKSTEGLYKNGELDGKWVYWDKNGKVTSEQEIKKLSAERKKDMQKALEIIFFPVYIFMK